ncbi:uncharacterized protein C8R40DRAFT_1113979 [Lentinula edodes]|uniref:uncharacterized protein n=1 Tax=Lentinula edodes TaxID=5353 RepID=UPI001E8D7DE6|nr:uncharacterized protein C8R40DRAFT_1113979 [Lentinula edodes]KAH7873112.1 hypothetical protein C8R40DRAFT_1113979 [Lentinula edodes]
MGLPRIDSVALLSREKDQEILQLKLQLKAYAARTSLIQSRLTSTQDALDALQLSHDEELRAEQAVKHKMQERLKTYYQFLRSVNYEKEDLRDAIVSFLQREDPHNSWPQSQLHVSSLVQPADPKLLMHRNQDVSNDFDQRLMDYAAAMIDILVHERDLARTAHHERTRTGFEPFTPMDSSVLSKILQKTSTRHQVLELGNQQLEGQSISAPLASTSHIKYSDRIRLDETSREIQDDSDPTVRMSPTNGDVAPSLENVNPTSKLIAQMDTDIRNLVSAPANLEIESRRSAHLFQDNTSVDMEVAYAASLCREKSLIEDNLKLVERLRNLHSSDVPDSDTEAKENMRPLSRLTAEPELKRSASPAPPQPTDAEDGEVSMDLATPLLPTTFIATPDKTRHSNTSGTPSTPRPLIPICPAPVSSSLFGQEQSPSCPRQGQSSVPSEDIQSVGPLNQPSADDVGNEIASELASREQQVVQNAGTVNETELILDSRTNLND